MYFEFFLKTGFLFCHSPGKNPNLKYVMINILILTLGPGITLLSQPEPILSSFWNRTGFISIAELVELFGLY